MNRRKLICGLAAAPLVAVVPLAQARPYAEFHREMQDQICRDLDLSLAELECGPFITTYTGEPLTRHVTVTGEIHWAQK
jgi:hypothetical protein